MRWMFAAFLVGCGWSEDRYHEEWVSAFCDKNIECEYGALFGWETVDDCLAEYGEMESTAAEAECEDYDGSAARACVTDYSALSCDELFEPEKWPEACDVICSNT